MLSFSMVADASDMVARTMDSKTTHDVILLLDSRELIDKKRHTPEHAHASVTEYQPVYRRCIRAKCGYGISKEKDELANVA